MRRARRGPGARRGLLIVAVAALALVAAACDPVLHPTATTVEPMASPVRFRDLSTDGRYALVESSGATATIPGPGWWRVDRVDGTVQEFRAGWSPDGRRYRFAAQPNIYAPQVWQDGVVRAAPAFSKLSPNLRFAVVPHSTTTRYLRWDYDTGSLVDVETGHPRPAGFTNLNDPYRIAGVSDDGNVVWFALWDPVTYACVTRFVDLAANQVADQPICNDAVQVSANGRGFVMPTNNVTYGSPWVTIGGPQRLELWQSFGTTGLPARVLDVPSTQGWWYNAFALADDGLNLWAVEAQIVDASTGWFARNVVAANLFTVRSFPADGDATFANANPSYRKSRFSITTNGRWFAYGTGVPGDPAHVLDSYNGHDEELTSETGMGLTDVVMSDDGAVVGHAETSSDVYFGTGWFEHEVGEQPGL